jgi:hypothetical protein
MTSVYQGLATEGLACFGSHIKKSGGQALGTRLVGWAYCKVIAWIIKKMDRKLADVT